MTAMFDGLLSVSAASAFFQVVMIDLVLAGDNAIVIGLAAAGLPRRQRTKAICIGIAAATVLRIVLSLVAVQLLAIVGLLLAGGILLLWVSWKMWRELHSNGADCLGHVPEPKTFRQAAWQIVAADISMSLDNVLAVGGAARDHPAVLVFGLALSIAMMAVASAFIAGLLQRHRWIGFAGLLAVVYVALEMTWRGAVEIGRVLG